MNSPTIGIMGASFCKILYSETCIQRQGPRDKQNVVLVFTQVVFHMQVQ